MSFFLKYLHQFRKFKKFLLICPKKTPCGMKFVTDTEMVFSGKCGGQSVQLHQNEFLQTKRQKMFLILTFSSIIFIDVTFGCRMRARKLKAGISLKFVAMQWQLTQLITGTAVIVHISQCSLQDWINERRLKKH